MVELDVSHDFIVGQTGAMFGSSYRYYHKFYNKSKIIRKGVRRKKYNQNIEASTHAQLTNVKGMIG